MTEFRIQQILDLFLLPKKRKIKPLNCEINIVLQKMNKYRYSPIFSVFQLHVRSHILIPQVIIIFILRADKTDIIIPILQLRELKLREIVNKWKDNQIQSLGLNTDRLLQALWLQKIHILKMIETKKELISPRAKWGNQKEQSSSKEHFLLDSIASLSPSQLENEKSSFIKP